MILHQNLTEFVKAVNFTAETMGIKSIYVEKDYWVSYALFTIFTHEIGRDTVFKGGTALSKCYNMVDRFSEDIDLVVLRREGESNNKLTTKIRTISDVVNRVLPEITIEGITQKMGMNRKTAHSYNKEFSGDFGQVRDAIVVESTWLGYHEPYTTKSIVSFVGQMMLDNRQSDFAKENGLLPFELQVLEPVRTICEKIMSLVRFSYSENPVEDLKKKIRHIYDLHQLLQQAEFSKFLHSEAFDSMLLKVANDDVASFKNNNKWLIYHPNEALIFKDPENFWNELKIVYKGDFKNLVYGELPKEESVLETLKMIQERMQSISWTIKIEGVK
ncbi:nucleotidyl transferase AbiEii/AbiGii toxin family protein [Aquiflexum sp. LQ15W]|uniref:nucleotidyl transferase AbiEii/AbiGii toxin family protein n=1 Tax=Cognataquiflexum nitidum TaxID=2922272 RepID=UPI001F13BF99|nr:nucleotidyl transferase AbiEii/AbiGii toxin family protein [Cognataquiflexum nitidum]MCH6199727.1 nucleotidyl transferase AbiEii/AbiGii toxin family protein [Cognataquiflexum nitidum]